MSIERTRQVMNRYWDSDHKDVSMMADDVVFTHMATGDEHRGPDGVRRMLDYMYRQAFTATADRTGGVHFDPSCSSALAMAASRVTASTST